LQVEQVEQVLLVELEPSVEREPLQKDSLELLQALDR
jgi:hypothetical protein